MGDLPFAGRMKCNVEWSTMVEMIQSRWRQERLNASPESVTHTKRLPIEPATPVPEAELGLLPALRKSDKVPFNTIITESGVRYLVPIPTHVPYTLFLLGLLHKHECRAKSAQTAKLGQAACFNPSSPRANRTEYVGSQPGSTLELRRTMRRNGSRTDLMELE